MKKQVLAAIAAMLALSALGVGIIILTPAAPTGTAPMHGAWFWWQTAMLASFATAGGIGIWLTTQGVAALRERKSPYRKFTPRHTTRCARRVLPPVA